MSSRNSFNPRSLKRDKAALLRLHAALRLSQELVERLEADPTAEQSAEWQWLNHIMTFRIQEVMHMVQARGSTNVQADKMVRAVLQEMMSALTPDECRALMPLAEAIGVPIPIG